MTEARRFPPPCTIEEKPESFVVRVAAGQALGYFLFRGCARPAAVNHSAPLLVTCGWRERPCWRFAIAVLFAPTAIHAQIALENSSGYNCTIKDLRTLKKDGGTEPRSTAGISSFIVDRASGRILGTPVPISSPTKRCTLVRRGSCTSDCCKSWNLKSGPVKSFLFVDGSRVFSGTCTHLSKRTCRRG
jgi:hypothetical protein